MARAKSLERAILNGQGVMRLYALLSIEDLDVRVAALRLIEFFANHSSEIHDNDRFARRLFLLLLFLTPPHRRSKLRFGHANFSGVVDLLVTTPVSTELVVLLLDIALTPLATPDTAVVDEEDDDTVLVSMGSPSATPGSVPVTPNRPVLADLATPGSTGIAESKRHVVSITVAEGLLRLIALCRKEVPLSLCRLVLRLVLCWARALRSIF